MQPIFVSFYTTGTGYEAEAAGLVASLEQFGLARDVAGLAPAGGWTANCNLKSAFVRDMLIKHGDRPVVWLDADARVRMPPVYFDSLDCDFAAHWRDGHELLSGTLYFGNTTGARVLADKWVAECKVHPRDWDQHNLQRAVDAMPTLRVANLPPAYTQIFDLMKHHGAPVIEHLQASRRLKREVGR